MNKYIFEKELGKGQFGTVALYKDVLTEEMVAIKIINRTSSDNIICKNLEQNIASEKDILSQLSHPRVIKLIEYFEEGDDVVFVMEYIENGDLYKKLMKEGFTEAQVAKYILQVIEGLEYLHSKNIIHRDIKPENLLLTADDDIKICDFGWSIMHEEGLNRLCGSPLYLAPEVIDQNVYDFAIDRWSLGVLCYELVSGKAPFDDNTKMKIYNKIRRLNYKFPPNISEDCKDFIKKLLLKNPDERMSLSEAKQHPFIQRVKGLLNDG